MIKNNESLKKDTGDPLEANASSTIRTMHDNIVNLISVLDNTAGKDATFQTGEVDDLHRNTYALLDKFKTRMTEMEDEFHAMLQEFDDGSMSSFKFHALLEAEQQKGQFALEASEEVIKGLDTLYSTISKLLLSVSDEDPEMQPHIETVVRTLDNVMGSVLGISRVASSTPLQVARSLHHVQFEQAQLRAHSEKGYFATLMANAVNATKKVEKEVSYEDALKFFSENTSENLIKEITKLPPMKKSVRMISSSSLNNDASPIDNYPLSPLPSSKSPTLLVSNDMSPPKLSNNGSFSPNRQERMPQIGSPIPSAPVMLDLASKISSLSTSKQFSISDVRRVDAAVRKKSTLITQNSTSNLNATVSVSKKPVALKKSNVMQKLRNKVKSGMLSIELSEEFTNDVTPEVAAKVLNKYSNLMLIYLTLSMIHSKLI